MSVINKQTYYEKKEEMIHFIKENRKKYQDYYYTLLTAIDNDFGLELQENCPMKLKQIFSKFDIYNEESDEYKAIARLLKQYSLLEGNCAEIGAGVYPRLSEITLPMIKGKLTIYEPSIEFTDFNAKIVKKCFTRKTNISDIDTLYALYPCKATIPILEKAFRENKNLLLAFCECNHANKKRKNNYLANDVCDDYLKKYKNEIEILNWPPEVKNLDLPIMIRKRK